MCRWGRAARIAARAPGESEEKNSPGVVLEGAHFLVLVFGAIWEAAHARTTHGPKWSKRGSLYFRTPHNNTKSIMAGTRQRPQNDTHPKDNDNTNGTIPVFPTAPRHVDTQRKRPKQNSYSVFPKRKPTPQRGRPILGTHPQIPQIASLALRICTLVSAALNRAAKKKLRRSCAARSLTGGLSSEAFCSFSARCVDEILHQISPPGRPKQPHWTKAYLKGLSQVLAFLFGGSLTMSTWDRSNPIYWDVSSPDWCRSLSDCISPSKGGFE